MKHCTRAPSRSVRKRTRCNRGTLRHSKGGTVHLMTVKKKMTIVFPPQFVSTTNPFQKEFLNIIFKQIQRYRATDLGNKIKNLCKSQRQLIWVAPVELYQLCVDYAISNSSSPESKILKYYMYILDYSYRGYDVIKGKDIDNDAHINIPLSKVFRCGHNMSPPKTVCDNPLQNSSNRSPLQPLNVNVQDENVQDENVQPKKSNPSIADRRRSKRKASKTQKKASSSHYPSMRSMR